jgi:chromosome segregation ATPase
MQTSDNSNSQTLALSAKNSKPSKTLKNSQPSKVKITKATKEQIKKAPKIIIDSDTEDDIGNNSDEDHFIEPSDDWTSADFEINYRKLLFFHNALKEENQGANEEIHGLKFRLEQATADALKLNTANIAQDDKIDNLEIDLIFIKKENNKLRRKLKDEENDNQQLIEERDGLQNELELLKLTNENLNNEIKDLKIYSNDNEENFFRVNEENKELQDTITGLQLEKEIICKQNEELSEKVKYFRQETLNQAGKRTKETTEKDKIIEELKRKLSDVDIERCNYKNELGCLRRDLKEITTKYNKIDSDNSDYIHELQDLKVAFKEMKEKNIKLNEGMGVFARQILDLELKIKKLIIMLEEYEALGALPNSMKWTLQCKLETFLKPDFKPVVDYPRHIINLGNGEFY